MSNQQVVLQTFGSWLLLAMLGGLVLWRTLKKRRARVRVALEQGVTPDAAGVAEFPVDGTHARAGFLGGQSSNSINPRFWVERDAVRIRILRSWHVPFADLVGIDARKTMFGMALIFQSAAGRRSFVVRFGDAALARDALARIAPSVPLTEAAATLRDGDARAATPGLQSYRGPLQ